MSRARNLEAEGQYSLPGLESHPALVHVLTSEFQGIDPKDFEDIPDNFIPYVHPDSLRPSLLEAEDGETAISYRTYEGSWKRIAVTPEEFGLLARHVPMLAKTAINGVLATRDKKLQEETGNPYAKARTDADLAASKRAAMRQVLDKGVRMRTYLHDELQPRIALIDQFKEMAQHKTLARGSYKSVSERVERLRYKVFGDMLDAVGNQRDWTEEQSKLAERTLQKKLYLDPDKMRRVKSFKSLLELADEYYGHKQALVLSRMAEVESYRRKHPEVYQNMLATDAARANGSV